MRHPLLLLLLCLLLSGCQNSSAPESTPPALTEFTGHRMTMPFRLLVGKHVSDEQGNKVEQVLEATFDEINRIHNKWNPNSELSRLNALPAGQKVELSPQLEKLLLHTDQLVQITGGRFDPTIEPLQQLWKSSLKEGREPDAEEVERVAAAVGWHLIHVEGGIFHKEHANTALDLGGIAKGLCVDLIVERLIDAGYPSVYFEWGGEIRTAGQHPEGRPWRVSISRFGEMNPDNGLAVVELSDTSLATSGDYMQNWTSADTTYFHIVDPRTGSLRTQTADSIGSVSVKAPSCMVADALATAGMMFESVEQAQAWADSIPTAEFWIASRKKTECQHPGG